MNTTLTENQPGFCERSRESRESILEAISLISSVCSCSDYPPFCDPEINCNGHGKCRYDGDCDCDPGYGPSKLAQGKDMCKYPIEYLNKN